MLESKATWQKLAWRIYKKSAHIVLALPLINLPLKSKRLRQRLFKLTQHFFCTALPNPTVAYGHVMYWDSRSYHYAMEYTSESYEKDTILLLKGLILPGMTIIDLGAHIGIYSLLAAQLVGNEGKVYSFEPEPSNYALLLKNITANGYDNIIRGINKAITDKPGSVSFFLGENSSGVGSIYAAPGTGTDNILVETTTLDDFIESEGWPSIHLIKMDVEGAEIEALKGAEDILKNNDVNLAIASYHKVEGKTTSFKLERMLSERGYKIETSFPEHLTTYAAKA